MVAKILFVGLGGGLGSIFRFLVSHYTNKYYVAVFPLATFIVNITGCLLIGLIIGFTQRHLSEDIKLFLITGICGGYTTFSAFAAENFKLFESGHYLTLAVYISTSILLGILAVWGGILLSKL